MQALNGKEPAPLDSTGFACPHITTAGTTDKNGNGHFIWIPCSFVTCAVRGNCLKFNNPTDNQKPGDSRFPEIWLSLKIVTAQIE